MDLALNNLRGLICHKTQQTQPFLDVLTDSTNNNKFITSPYKKPTNNNSTLLNYQSECLQKYKIAIIKSLIQRTFLHLI